MLTGNATKWYIELPRATINTFGALATEFLKNFQLPIRFETGTKLLTSLRQDTTTHISDHIHEWSCRKRLVKVPIPDHLLANWFCKSLLPHISKYIGLSGVITKDQCIRRAQHFDLIYSQSGTLYDFLPNAPGNPNPPATQKIGAHADSLVGTISGVATK